MIKLKTYFDKRQTKLNSKERYKESIQHCFLLFSIACGNKFTSMLLDTGVLHSTSFFDKWDGSLQLSSVCLHLLQQTAYIREQGTTVASALTRSIKWISPQNRLIGSRTLYLRTAALKGPHTSTGGELLEVGLTHRDLQYPQGL